MSHTVSSGYAGQLGIVKEVAEGTQNNPALEI